MTITSDVKQLSSKKAFDAQILQFQHTSKTLANLPAVFSVIIPPTDSVPVLYWLSGLTCTDQNFITKAGAAQYAMKHSVAIICPDTSPRGAKAPHEDESWDFGTGAGFYVNATTPGYEAYQMADYITKELPDVLKTALGERVDTSRASIFGHSMGGMGALALALNNPALYKSVSAFAPIVNPVECEWGKKCFSRYLGDNMDAWKAYDPTEILSKQLGTPFEKIMIEQGTADEFLESMLKPHSFVAACERVAQKVELNMAEGYDHSYFFIQTFIGKHIAFHAEILHT